MGPIIMDGLVRGVVRPVDRRVAAADRSAESAEPRCRRTLLYRAAASAERRQLIAADAGLDPLAGTHSAAARGMLLNRTTHEKT